MTFAAVAIYAAPAVLADNHADTRRPWIPVGLAGLAIIALATFGAIHLAAKMAREGSAANRSQPDAGTHDGIEKRIEGMNQSSECEQ